MERARIGFTPSDAPVIVPEPIQITFFTPSSPAIVQDTAVVEVERVNHDDVDTVIDGSSPAAAIIGSRPAITKISGSGRADTSLVAEEMRFCEEYVLNSRGDDYVDVPPRVVEAPIGTRFAMQKNLALEKRENAKLRESLDTANKEIAHSKEQVGSYQCQVSKLRQQKSSFLPHFHEQQYTAPFLVNFDVPKSSYSLQQFGRI